MIMPSVDFADKIRDNLTKYADRTKKLFIEENNKLIKKIQREMIDATSKGLTEIRIPIEDGFFSPEYDRDHRRQRVIQMMNRLEVVMPEMTFTTDYENVSILICKLSPAFKDKMTEVDVDYLNNLIYCQE